MIIYIKGHEFNYELEKLTRLFFPFERIDFVTDEIEIREKSGLFAAATAEKQGEDFLLNAKAKIGEKEVNKSKIWNINKGVLNLPEKELEHCLAGLLFDCYSELTNYKPAWGILTGIRPAKLYRRFENFLGDKVDDYFREVFKVDNLKLDLLRRTAKSEEIIVSRSLNNSVSIYISIPFCPSRCSYCSFVSHSIEKAADLIPEYLDLLCKEIEYTASIVKDLNLKVMTVYVGGGTPTTLTAPQMERLLKTVRDNFGEDFEEFTVEAGRPDTITKEKLEVILNAGADRISINPQTMNNSVLKAIGRRHTAEDTVEKFNLARSLGFKNINMDLIAGLPTDNLESFKNTLNQIVNLNPESVTIHSLSLKRSSNITKVGEHLCFDEGIMAGEMVSYGEKILTEKGILPYYMYRQSKTVGNLENVGYSKPENQGIYNVYIMDETHTILACGASAVSKLKARDDGKIERIFNFKYPYEYIKQFDEIIRRKGRIKEFYAEHSN